MMWITTALQIILFSQLARTQDRNRSPIRYIDFSMTNQDFYFDRIIMLFLTDGMRAANYGIGAMISSNRILTSFNPFRSIMTNKTLLTQLFAVVMTGRERLISGNWIYHMRTTDIACGRQIQDLPDDEISRGNLWHGMGNKHCPLHDLLVFRLDDNFKESDMLTKDHHMGNYPYGEHTVRNDSVFFTKLANPFQHLGGKFKFCAVIHRYVLKVTHYEEADNAVVDCDEWLPRDWGHFFCIINKNNYEEVSSGAMLVSNEMLFGVASFVLFRGAQSIIAFTDIRPYNELINNTCTFADSEEKSRFS